MHKSANLRIEGPSGHATGSALVVMAREPSAGRAKTRLSPPLTAEQAAELYRCFLLDTLDIMRHIEAIRPIIAYSPNEAAPFFRRIASTQFGILPQAGTDLAERLDNVIARCLETGYSSVVVIGSDSPTLPPNHIRQAFKALVDPEVDMVLGPSDDGGYYLIGLKSVCTFLFQGMVMSTATVASETLERARQHQLRVACLPKWYDVDTARDLERLAEELQDGPDRRASNTRAFLSCLSGRR